MNSYIQLIPERGASSLGDLKDNPSTGSTMYEQLDLFTGPTPVRSTKAAALRKLNRDPRLNKLRSGQKVALVEYLQQGLDINRMTYDRGTYSISLTGRESWRKTPPRGCDTEGALWWESANRWVEISAINREQTINTYSDRTYREYPCSRIS